MSLICNIFAEQNLLLLDDSNDIYDNPLLPIVSCPTYFNFPPLSNDDILVNITEVLNLWKAIMEFLFMSDIMSLALKTDLSKIMISYSRNLDTIDAYNPIAANYWCDTQCSQFFIRLFGYSRINELNIRWIRIRFFFLFVFTNKGALIRLFDYSQLKTKQEETANKSTPSCIFTRNGLCRTSIEY